MKPISKNAYFRILIADDSHAMRYQLKEIIEKNNITPHVYEAVNGKDAFEKFYQTNPDLVIMDINMPETNGLEAIRKIHALDKTVKIIVLSAVTSKNDVEDAMKFGACDYIVKPFNRAELSFKIIKILRQKTKDDNRRQELIERKILEQKDSKSNKSSKDVNPIRFS